MTKYFGNWADKNVITGNGTTPAINLVTPIARKADVLPNQAIAFIISDGREGITRPDKVTAFKMAVGTSLPGLRNELSKYADLSFEAA